MKNGINLLHLITLALFVSLIFTSTITYAQPCGPGVGTVLFNEDFEGEADGATSGTDASGVAWTATCPGCAASDFFEVDNNSGNAMGCNGSNGLRGNDTNGPGTFTAAGIDLTGCEVVYFNFDYCASGYTGTGNLECVTECSGCSGVPSEGVSNGGCNNCWDFLYGELNWGSGSAQQILLGDDCNAPPSGTTGSAICGSTDMDGNPIPPADLTSVDINIVMAMWAGSENMVIDNVMLICYTAAEVAACADPAVADACPPPACDEMAGEPNATATTVCATGTETGAAGELSQAAVDLTTFFPGPNSDDPADPDDVTNYFSFDAATGEFVSASSNTTIDLSNLGCGGEACVKEIVYTQSLLNDFVDGLNAIPGVNLGNPDLSGLFTQLNNLFGPYTETDINNILMNGITVLGVTVPWPAPFCYDFSDTQICFTVENCSPPCDLTVCNSVDLVICNLGWTGLDDQFTLGTEGTDADLELAWAFGGLGGMVFQFEGAESGSFNPGLTFTAGITECPGAANAVIEAEVCIWENDCDADNTFNGEMEPACEIIPGTIFTPPVTNGDDPLLGDATSPCSMVSFDFSTANGTASVVNGAYTFTFDYLPICAASACVCPTEVAVANEAYDVCDGGLAAEVGDWQTAVMGANPIDAVQDPCGFGSLVYSSVPDGDPAFPDGIIPTGVHSGADVCANEMQMVYAYLQCDAPDAAAVVQTTYALVSELSLTVWPAVQTAMADDDGLCGPAINTLPCAGYTVTNDYDANGASPDFSAETNTGTVVFTLTNPGAPAACSTLDVMASFNCFLPPPIPAFDCPGPTVNLCTGPVDLNAVDNEPTTQATSTGTWSGTGAPYVVLNGAGIGDDAFDPSGAPVGVQLTLILTLTDGSESASTVACTFMVVRDCAADGGSF